MLVVTEVLYITFEKVTEMLPLLETQLWLSVGEIEETVGAVVSIINKLIFNVTLLLELSVTVIVQSEKVPSLKETKVMVVFPEIAIVVLEEQEPPYEIVPASVDENI